VPLEVPSVPFTWRKQQYPTGGGGHNPHLDLKRLADSIVSIVPVANSTERDQLVTQAAQAGRQLTAENPGYFHRQDTGDLERNDGSGAVIVNSLVLSRFVPVPILGALGSEIDMIPLQNIPAVPFGQGARYNIRVRSSVTLGIPPGLGGTLRAWFDGVRVDFAEYTNGGGTTCRVTLHVDTTVTVGDNSAHTIQVTVGNQAGEISVAADASRDVEIHLQRSRAF
jgi:hypothetical protein